MATEKQGSLQMIFGRIPSIRDRGRRSSMGQQSGAGALHEAIAKGKAHLAKFIIEATEERTLVNVKDSHGKTPLIRACKHTDCNVRMTLAELLVKHGADVNIKDNVGRTALSYACQMKFNDIVGLLVKNNVDPNIEDNMSNTPLTYCAKFNNVGAIETIIKSFKRLGINIDHVNEEGLTPLMEAARNEYIECARILVQNGKASVTLRDPIHNLNAEEWALANGCSQELLDVFHKKKNAPNERNSEDEYFEKSVEGRTCSEIKPFTKKCSNSSFQIGSSTPEVKSKHIYRKEDDSLLPCLNAERNTNVSQRIPILARREKLYDYKVHQYRLHSRPRSATSLDYISRSFDRVDHLKQEGQQKSASDECLFDLTLTTFPRLPISISVENLQCGNCDKSGSSSELLQRLRRFATSASPTLKRNQIEKSISPETSYLPPI